MCLLCEVHSCLTARYAALHDASLRRTLTVPTRVSTTGCRQPPCLTRGLGLCSAVLTTIAAASWSSWADSLQMIQRRHPSVAGQFLHELSHRNTTGFYVAAAGAAREEMMRLGFEAPSLESVTAGSETCPTEQAVWRSQGGPLSGVPFQCFPFNTVSQSTLRSSAFCSSAVFGSSFLPLHAVVDAAVPLMSLATTGQLVLKQECWVAHALESAAARICREAGARVGTNTTVRDMDLSRWCQL